MVYVINIKGKPLMPCSNAIARLLLKQGKAKCITRVPFTIKLLNDTSNYKQAIIGGMDTGSKTIGVATISNGAVVYQAEVAIRQNVSKKMQQRAMYRRTRRGRKCRYRQARWLNRANSLRGGRLAPSLLSKVQSHLREKKQVESILPVTSWNVEVAEFDIHKIINPQVSGVDYQQGKQLGFYNIKQYVLDRDGYKCQSGRKVPHNKKLHVHHVIFKSKGGTNMPDNLITLYSTKNTLLKVITNKQKVVIHK